MEYFDELAETFRKLKFKHQLAFGARFDKEELDTDVVIPFIVLKMQERLTVVHREIEIVQFESEKAYVYKVLQIVGRILGLFTVRQLVFVNTDFMRPSSYVSFPLKNEWFWYVSIKSETCY